MKSDHSEENYSQDNEVDDIVIQGPDEEPLTISSITLDCSADNKSDINSYSSNDDNDNEIS